VISDLALMPLAQVVPWLVAQANGLPYSIPIHPNLVHLTLGLFIVAIAFDIVAALYPLEKPIFKFLAIPVLSSNLYDVGWFNMLAAAIVTFFTVAAGFYEIILADPSPDAFSPWGLSAIDTMVWHGLGGVVLLAMIVGMTIWRGLALCVAGRSRPSGPMELLTRRTRHLRADVFAGHIGGASGL